MILLAVSYYNNRLSRTSPGELVLEETFICLHLSWSSTTLYQFPPSIITHSILHVQFTCLTVFLHTLCPKSSLVYLLVRKPPLHTPYIISLNHCFLFAAHARTIATWFTVVTKLCHLFLISISQLFTWNSIFYINITHSSDHSHLCSLKCHFIFYPYRPGPTSVPHILLHAWYCTEYK